MNTTGVDARYELGRAIRVLAPYSSCDAQDVANAIADYVDTRLADDLRAKLLALLDTRDTALCAREHGGVADGNLVDGVRELLGVDGFERRRVTHSATK